MIDADIFAKDQKYYLPVFDRYKIVLDHGDGPYVYDINGKKYLDFLAGIAVNVLGHNYPPLVMAIRNQAGKMIHCSNLYYTQPQVEAASRLSHLSKMNKVFFGNSGAEANEGAIKLARKYAHMTDKDKSLIICANHSFHGRTIATLTATGQPKYHQGFGPLPDGFVHVDYNNISQLETIINDKTCAVMLEAIQGEGGIHVPDKDYLQKVRALCNKYNVLLIFDEIQCGMGRTGTFFAFEQFGIKADIVTLAKGLAGGVPIGAFITNDKIARAFHPGDHGTTFGGNPLACAAANVVLDAMENGGLMENAANMGKYLIERLQTLKEKYPSLIKQVRGKGLMVGAELNKPGKKIVDECLEKNVIINCTAGNVLRFVPPLIIKKQHIDSLILVLDKVLAEHV